MTTAFVKFPRTPHLAWLGKHPPRDDKVLPRDEAIDLLTATVLVEEKIDGANIGISFDREAGLRAQSRGEYLKPGSHSQFAPLWTWLERHREILEHHLGTNLVLFGEWCFARHTVPYDRLPDWFLAFDVYNRYGQGFLGTSLRDQLVSNLGVFSVPQLACGRFSLTDLRELLGRKSQVGSAAMEGIYLRRDEGNWLKARAKLVRPDFVESIEQHWSRLPVKRNALWRRQH